MTRACACVVARRAMFARSLQGDFLVAYWSGFQIGVFNDHYAAMSRAVFPLISWIICLLAPRQEPSQRQDCADHLRTVTTVLSRHLLGVAIFKLTYLNYKTSLKSLLINIACYLHDFSLYQATHLAADRRRQVNIAAVSYTTVHTGCTLYSTATVSLNWVPVTRILWLISVTGKFLARNYHDRYSATTREDGLIPSDPDDDDYVSAARGKRVICPGHLVPSAPQASLDLLCNPDWTDAEVYAQYLGPTGSLAAAEKLWHDIGHVIPVTPDWSDNSAVHRTLICDYDSFEPPFDVFDSRNSYADFVNADTTLSPNICSHADTSNTDV
eukprot:g64242.t1